MHGYDLHDAVLLSSTRFVSIAEEKVARVFEAPRSFVLLAKQLGYLPDVTDENDVSITYHPCSKSSIYCPKRGRLLHQYRLSVYQTRH